MRIVGPGGPIDVNVPGAAALHVEGMGMFSIENSGESDIEDTWVDIVVDGPAVWVNDRGYTARFTLPESHGVDTDHEARAPMTGKVVAMPVKIGDTVKRGDTVAVLEAMKMEYKLEAEADGIVEEIGAKEGDLVDLGQLLVRLK